MKILVANLGSTSFKYRLYDLGDSPGAGAGGEHLKRAGAVERIGRGELAGHPPLAPRRGHAGRADQGPR